MYNWNIWDQVLFYEAANVFLNNKCRDFIISVWKIILSTCRNIIEENGKVLLILQRAKEDKGRETKDRFSPILLIRYMIV